MLYEAFTGWVNYPIFLLQLSMKLSLDGSTIQFSIDVQYFMVGKGHVNESTRWLVGETNFPEKFMNGHSRNLKLDVPCLALCMSILTKQVET